LSEKLDISKSGTSKFVKKLLSKGLVTKNQNPGNRKEFYYDLTEKGKLAFAGHKKFSAETFNRITGLLNKMTEEESLFLEKFLTDLVLEVEELNKRY
jgi:DNA-binding MarR family transcriptional regulator